MDLEQGCNSQVARGKRARYKFAVSRRRSPLMQEERDSTGLTNYSSRANHKDDPGQYLVATVHPLKGSM